MDNGELYEQRAIAFLDILGFSEIIKDAKRIAEVHELQKEIRAAAAEAPNLGEGIQLTFFSDSIVISTPIGNGNGAVMTTIFSGYIQQLLLSREFLIRGAIAAGQLHHDGPIIFGPAMIEAYEQESKGTYYPRIVVSDAVVDLSNQYAASQSAEHSKMFTAMYSADFDGQKYVDIFSPAIVPVNAFMKDKPSLEDESFKIWDISENVIPFVQKFCADAKADPRLAKTPGAASKYDWLLNYIEQCRVKYNWK